MCIRDSFQIDQPSLALPRAMYLDTEKYADFIATYKTFMLDTAIVMTRYVLFSREGVPEIK